jgi:hypothetical protein
MSKETFVFICGVIFVIVPFLGIPENWQKYIIAGAGALLILTGYSLRHKLYLERIDRGNGERGSDSFVETTPQLFEDNAVK